MPITGIIIRTHDPLQLDIVEYCQLSEAITLSEVAPGAVVIVLETPDAPTERLALEDLERLNGVVAVEVIYHNFEDLEVS